MTLIMHVCRNKRYAAARIKKILVLFRWKYLAVMD